MGERTIKLPDVGEGVAEAEIVEVHVTVGDAVREDQVLAAVMTDKATVEIPSPVDGKVLWVGVSVGQTVAVGSQIIGLLVEGDGRAPSEPEPADATVAAPTLATVGSDPKPVEHAASPTPVPPKPASNPAKAPRAVPVAARHAPHTHSLPRVAGERPLTSPAVRGRARELGIDLSFVPGSGPTGRVLHHDLDAFLAGPTGDRGDLKHVAANTSIEEIKVVGLRRTIAQRMQDTMRRIPHFSYIEEVDVTDLEALRRDVNGAKRSDRPKLTVLPFVMRALVIAVGDFPQMNSRFDDETETVHRYGGVHIGVATQTPNGLMVPVARHVEALGIWNCAREVARLADAARSGTATRDELGGSTITITSLGALGGLATTPIINSPEVAIVGINKIAIRPIWRGNSFEPRRVMNLSSSFDHRVIDGWDAAQFIQRIRSLLETPAKIFSEA